jgi:hypothetical protein
MKLVAVEEIIIVYTWNCTEVWEIIDYEMYERGTSKKMTELWISNVLFNVIYFEA